MADVVKLDQKPESKKRDWTPLSPDILAFLGLPVIAVIGILFAIILPGLSYLRQQGQVGFFAVALFLGIVGICLLFLARLPLYRRKQFFAFGPGQLDATHRKLYWWAYGFAVVSIFMLVKLIFAMWASVLIILPPPTR
jgi:Na+/melibiose symporter-like transporter